MTSEEPDIPLGGSRRSSVKLLGWGLLVGAAVASLPWAAVKVDSNVLLLIGEVLGWPGAVVGLAFGGWNARPFTVILYYSVTLALYIGLTYCLLSMRERRKQRNQERPGPTA
ncbi:MAG: hypothetical protein WAM13_12760 [Candidatus Sulfotelmatobacter sp.]